MLKFPPYKTRGPQVNNDTWSAGLLDDKNQGRVIPGVNLLHQSDNVHPLHHLPEDDMHPIQMGRWSQRRSLTSLGTNRPSHESDPGQCDEELGTPAEEVETKESQ